jgi:hypothetical protein
MHTLEQLEAMLIINRENLEEELLHQPQLFYEVSESHAEAMSKRDMAKHAADTMFADLGMQYRATHSTEKVTEAATERAVTADPTYVKQLDWYLKYKAESDKWGALQDAYAQRVSMLRDLIQLLVQGYWGTGITKTDAMNSTFSQAYQKQHHNKS